MDRRHSSVISKGSSTTYSIPSSTQHDARQRCPALVVVKEENNNDTVDDDRSGQAPKCMYNYDCTENWKCVNDNSAMKHSLLNTTKYVTCAKPNCNTLTTNKRKI